MAPPALELSERAPILGERRPATSRGIPVRYVLGILGFIGFLNVYAMRVNLSVAMVGMVNSSVYVGKDGLPEMAACPELLPHNSNGSLRTRYQNAQQFNWDAEAQAIILGSFFYGYVVTQIPGGILAERFGAKWFFGVGVLVTSIFTLLTPIAAFWGFGALTAVRVIEGLAEGVTFPAVNLLIGKWTPKSERSRMSTLIFTGSPVGTVIAMALSGILADSDFLGGWPSVFYVFGILGCFWFFAWIFAIHENPQDHPRISESELTYIQENVDRRTSSSTPFKAIFSSVPVWALAFTHFGQNWGFYTLLTEMPTYLATILHFDLKANGLLSALPYVMQALCAWMASYIADRLRRSGKFSITTIRKLMNSIAFFGPGTCVFLVAFAGCRPALIIVLLCLALGTNGFMYSGFNVTHVDMSPAYAGTLMGITNCISNFSGFLAPRVVGIITSRGETNHNWGLVFVIASAVYFFSGFIYNIFCTAELQPWGVSSQEDVSSPPPFIPEVLQNSESKKGQSSPSLKRGI